MMLGQLSLLRQVLLYVQQEHAIVGNFLPGDEDLPLQKVLYRELFQWSHSDA
jgi:hypothetical protein